MSKEHQKRRRRQTLCIRTRRLHEQADRICDRVGQLDTVVGAVTDLARDAHQLLGENETIALLTPDVRGTLEQAIGRLEEVNNYLAIPADVCEGLDKAFQNAEDILESLISAPADGPTPGDGGTIVGRPTWVKLALGGTGVGLLGVVGLLAAAAVNTVTINVLNTDCGDIPIPPTIANIVAFIPGVEVPDSLPEGEVVIIRLPTRLAETLAVRGRDEIAVHGLGLDLAFALVVRNL